MQLHCQSGTFRHWYVRKLLQLGCGNQVPVHPTECHWTECVSLPSGKDWTDSVLRMMHFGTLAPRHPKWQLKRNSSHRNHFDCNSSAQFVRIMLYHPLSMLMEGTGPTNSAYQTFTKNNKIKPSPLGDQNGTVDLHGLSFHILALRVEYQHVSIRIIIVAALFWPIGSNTPGKTSQNLPLGTPRF